ncbi:MAG: hypothetical protein AAB425_11815, partial [Bdellovibrionota bacterium]
MKNRRNWQDLLLVSLLYFALVYAIAPWGAFPLNDDWVPTGAALKTAQSLLPELRGFESAWGFTQTWITGLLLRFISVPPESLFPFCRILGVAVGFSTVVLLWRMGAPLVALLTWIGFFPFLPLSLSFMTDLPFLFLVALVAWLYDRGASLLAFGVLCALAFAQRQYAILLIPAAFFAHPRRWLAQPGNHLASLALFGTLSAAAYLAHERALQALVSAPDIGNRIDWIQFPSLQQRVGNLAAVWLYLGIALLPLLLCMVKKVPRLRLAVAFAGAVGAVYLARWNFASLMFSGDRTMPFFGNLLSKYGIFKQGETIPGERMLLFRPIFWWVYTGAAVVGATLLAQVIWIWIRT